MEKKKKEKSPWLKTKKKTGPKKKKKVFDEDSEKLLPKPHKRIAHKPRYNNRYIEFFEALSLATYCAQRWPPGCEWKDLHQTCKAGKLGYWTASLQQQFIRMDNGMYKKYFNIPQWPHFCLQLFFRVDTAHLRGHCSFPFLQRIFSARHFARKSEKFWLVIELRSRTQLFSGTTPVIPGDSAVGLL